MKFNLGAVRVLPKKEYVQILLSYIVKVIPRWRKYKSYNLRRCRHKPTMKLFTVAIIFWITIVWLGLCKAEMDNKNSPTKHKKVKKIEIIPADELLRKSQFPEYVEQELANERIGRKRRGNSLRKSVTKERQRIEEPDIQEVQIHEHKVLKGHKHVKLDDAHSLAANDQENEIEDGSVDESDGIGLLQKLETLRVSLQTEIEELKKKSSDKNPKSQNNTKALVAATSELVRRVREINSSKMKKDGDDDKSLLPYRACIYIDVPGSKPGEEVEVFNPENMKTSCPQQKAQPTKETVEEADDEENDEEDEDENDESESENNDVNETDENVGSMDNIYWLHMPANGILNKQEVGEKLYSTIDQLHQSGNDVLFIPIAKGYSNPDEVKNGFLKSLQIHPERYDKYEKLEVNLIK